MRIKEITYQYRRDFRAIYECEHCGYTYEGRGYDDTNYHENVIPDIVCPKCGKKAATSYSPRETKYPDWMQV